MSQTLQVASSVAGLADRQGGKHGIYGYRLHGRQPIFDHSAHDQFNTGLRKRNRKTEFWVRSRIFTQLAVGDSPGIAGRITYILI
jgi:hypothetical protein